MWLHAIRPLPELASLAAAAEDAGAAAILVADEGTDRDLHVTLAALAARTRRVLLIAAITNPFSRHPVATAAAFASLAELAPGRIVAGFGAGGSRVLGPLGVAPARPYRALVETLDVVEDLLAGKVVDHDGEFTVRGAALPWTTGRLPIALAGRGPRVERLAAERADWVLLAGKRRDRLEPLVQRLRTSVPGRSLAGRAAPTDQVAPTGRPAPAIAWNPSPAWTDAMVDELRSHFAYMTVDLPPADRQALGVDDDLVVRLDHLVNTKGPEAAAALVPDAVVEQYAVVGTRAEVVSQLGAWRERIRPELWVFDAGDYSVSFLDEVAGVATDAGAVSF
jgi:5,10-methylenetetrahydromethanopterin reductase